MPVRDITMSVRGEAFRKASMPRTASWRIKPNRAQPSAAMTALASAVLTEWSPVRSLATPETSIR